MSLATEALEYWNICQRYRGSYSQVAKVHAAHVEVPTLYLKSTNPRINMQLANIMNEEGISYDEEAQPYDPCG
jgi:hypothetical protein